MHNLTSCLFSISGNEEVKRIRVAQFGHCVVGNQAGVI
jgi:hypothetical protein